jgi:hypothetical protein
LILYEIFYPLAVFGVLVIFLLFAGCTSTTPHVQKPTYAPTTTVALTPATTPPPLFPNALALNETVQFGSGNKQGEATVYNYEVLSNYNWTSPERNNPYQEVAAGPSGIENGYNTETPHEGNTFLFVFVKILNTGKDAIYAPSANQFVVYSNGAAYNQSSIPTSGVTINQVSGTQFVDLTGSGGTVGVVRPGEGNALDGYLIYQIPSSFSPNATYVTCSLDFVNQSVWKLS